MMHRCGSTERTEIKTISEAIDQALKLGKGTAKLLKPNGELIGLVQKCLVQIAVKLSKN